MKKLECRSWRHILRSTRGSEIAETAMILPLFFMMFMGVFWFGQAFRIYGTLTHATRLGAEAAVAPACTTCAAGTAATNAKTAVYNALAAAHLNKSDLVATKSWTSPMLCTCGTVTSSSSCTSAASCDGTVTDVCVQVNVQLSYPTASAMGTCGTSVSARYQYSSHFHIPLTTMDLGNMLLPGQAQMRAESQ
jgi:Flp pilus assembly protein TadG